MKKLLVVLLVLFIVGCAPKVEDCNMAIEITQSSTEIVSFAANTDLNDMDTKTVIAVIESFGENAGAAGKAIASKIDGAFTAGWFMALSDDAGGGDPNQLFYSHHFANEFGVWHSNDSIYIDNSIVHYAVTFDQTSDANNPVMYFNGASVTVNESTVPDGAAGDDSGATLKAGNSDYDGASGLTPFGGIIYKILIYDRILTATEIKEDFDSLQYIPSFNGLVFACGFHGAGGLQTYEGATIGGANTFKDFVNGLIGTPANNPTGRGDNVLHYGHLQWQEGRGGS